MDRVVEEAPHLGKAPAQRAARIVRDVPQQLAELVAMDRARRHDEIGDQRPHFTRRRGRRVYPGSHDPEGAEQPHRNREARRPADVLRIHRQLPHNFPPVDFT
jgi:hypothetical protein